MPDAARKTVEKAARTTSGGAPPAIAPSGRWPSSTEESSATPKAPPISRKNIMQETAMPPSRASTAFWMVTVIGENWQPKDRPSSSVTAVSSGSEWPRPMKAISRHISVATAAPSTAKGR